MNAYHLNFSFHSRYLNFSYFYKFVFTFTEKNMGKRQFYMIGDGGGCETIITIFVGRLC